MLKCLLEALQMLFQGRESAHFSIILQFLVLYFIQKNSGTPYHCILPEKSAWLYLLIS
jgi:hypothetical protein